MKTPLTRLVDGVIAVVLSEFYQRKRKGYTDPSEVTQAVLRDKDIAFFISRFPTEDPLHLKPFFITSLRNLVHSRMKGGRDEYDVRLWETVAIAGRPERRWIPTRGVMNVKEWRDAGQKKIDESKRDYREGRLLVLMSQVAEQLGLGLYDVPTGATYNQIATDARVLLSQDDGSSRGHGR